MKDSRHRVDTQELNVVLKLNCTTNWKTSSIRPLSIPACPSSVGGSGAYLHQSLGDSQGTL